MVLSKFDSLRSYVLGVLGNNLPANLFYHGVHHTRDDVLPAVERLAFISGIGGEDLLSLKTAALLHDTGFLKKYRMNENLGVAFAYDILPSFDYSLGQVERIGVLIMSTRLKMVDGRFVQVPDNADILQQMLCDGDLDVLGRDDFFVAGENLRRELREYGHDSSLKEWLENQLCFQEGHAYFTEAARSLRNPGKEKNMRELGELLGKA